MLCRKNSMFWTVTIYSYNMNVFLISYYYLTDSKYIYHDTMYDVLAKNLHTG